MTKRFSPVASMMAVFGTVLVLGGCATTDYEDAAEAPVAVPGARAALVDSAGNPRGTARVTATTGGLQLTIDAVGLPAGPHGTHIHMTGKCEAPDFTSAGSHWNPHGRQHGLQNPQGAHSGDLPNLLIGADGRGSLSIDLPGAHLTGEGGLLDADGAAIIVHATADDNMTDPTGNSGGRIACGVFAAG